MQKPDDLDIVKPAPEVDSGPPEPLADNEASKPIVNTFLSWLRRSLAVGTVLAIILLVFLSVLSAIFIAVDKPAPRPDVTVNLPPADEEELTETEEEPLSFDSFAASNLAPVTTTRSNVRRRRARSPRIHVKAYRQRRPRRRAPLVPLFMPTTLIIYVENGMIKTRTEPWIQTTLPLTKRQR